ncbi:MAG TPA: GNAT family N-acetyltransferase [Candidatus Limnocylindrales bacterium]|nr:GNAT family N-acetyltransferase [Candidatus Limnocylindrales bacterium]
MEPNVGSTSGRVVQVSISRGGVPKLPIPVGRVGRLGVEGDAHHEDTVHGGPHRALCLLAMEAIERMQADGHPIGPGSAGENLTTTGIEWSLLPVGTRARIGDMLEIELSDSTTPCSTQVANFSDGNFNRMNIVVHPPDSRMYARVVSDGPVRPGDEIRLSPPLNENAADELLLKRLDRAETKSSVAAWKAAKDAGFQIHVVEDGELAMSASPDIPGPAFNQASGLARIPNLLSRATEFYDRQGTTGYVWLEAPPWPNAEVSLELGMFAGDPLAVPAESAPEGVLIRRIDPDEAERYTQVRSGSATAGGVTDAGPNPWPQVYAELARHNARQLFLAEIDGRPVGNGSLHISARTGWLRGATVSPEARGRGIQRALVAARVAAAIEAGCDLVGAAAETGAVSAQNLERMGFRQVGRRSSYVYEPQPRLL